MSELMQRLLDAQSASDARLVELEDKQLKMEERQVEREAQLRREERDFQLRMITNDKDDKEDNDGSCKSYREIIANAL